ncbi:hypothetical protein F66182_8780 [Fusarium sp. NRRL 66182]|nr:hypothetical protein F66182_8780 [Fusarium sp. NRRL 66182]
MSSPQPPPSQASSHFPLEPIPASVLADKEARRRDATAILGPCKTGCAAIDQDVLLGGLERASVVGISAEDEELGIKVNQSQGDNEETWLLTCTRQLGLQTLAHSLCEGTITDGLVITPKPTSVMLAGLRDAVKAELGQRGDVKDVKIKLRQCLDKVMLSCVFDLDGLWEVLADLDPSEPAEEGAEKHDMMTAAAAAENAQVDEIQDSQDDDDDKAFSPIRQASQPRSEKHPEVIMITHFSSLLTSLFTHREKSAARSALQLLGSHLRDLSRNLASAPLIMLLNSTTWPCSGPAATATSPPPAKQTPIDPTLRSVFSTATSRRTKPSFGMLFAQLLDTHLLCIKIPRTRLDAGAAVQRREEVGMSWVVEVLLDEMGVWEGRKGARLGREQRWTAVDVERGRVTRSVF